MTHLIITETNTETGKVIAQRVAEYIDTEMAELFDTPQLELLELGQAVDIKSHYGVTLTFIDAIKFYNHNQS